MNEALAAQCGAPDREPSLGKTVQRRLSYHPRSLPDVMKIHAKDASSPVEIVAFENADDQIEGHEGRWRDALVGNLKRGGLLFWLTVLIPTLISTVYYGFLASDVYLSESSFVIRSPEKQTRGGIGLLLGSAGFSNASEEVRAAQGYIHSRDALRALNADDFARNAWAHKGVSIFDRFNGFGLSGSFEDLYVYYEKMVGISTDTETGISHLSVRAFTPKEAQRINQELLGQAEGLVNRLNQRGEEDLIRYAEREVQEANEQARAAALELAKFRNKAGVIDPERQATVQLQMISKLQDELVGARLQLLQLRSISRDSPQIPVLEVRIRGLQSAINDELGAVAGNSGSLSAVAAQYQTLQVQRQFADQQLGVALTALQEARNDARRQRAYLERISEPSLADDSMEPRRLRGIVTVFLLGLVIWGVVAMLLAGVREHRR